MSFILDIEFGLQIYRNIRFREILHRYGFYMKLEIPIVVCTEIEIFNFNTNRNQNFLF